MDDFWLTRFDPLAWFIALNLFLLHAVFLAWLAVDARSRDRRWRRWALTGTVFGYLVLIPWLVSRRRSPVVHSVPRRRILMSIPIFLAVLIGYDIATAVLIKYGFQVARIEGHAMSPSYHDQDRLIVNKLVYLMKEPEVGDVVMLRYPHDTRKLFVKRLIASGGDRVRIENGRLYRNEQLLDEPFVAPEYRSAETWGPAVVPEGHYFVLGDRRNNSSDSRHWGFVARDHVTGRVGFVWFRSNRN